MIQHEETPKVGMTVIKIRSASMYTVDVVEADRVYLRPYWAGRGSRSTWKTRTHLWRDYRRIDDTAVSATAKHVNGSGERPCTKN